MADATFIRFDTFSSSSKGVVGASAWDLELAGVCGPCAESRTVTPELNSGFVFNAGVPTGSFGGDVSKLKTSAFVVVSEVKSGVAEGTSKLNEEPVVVNGSLSFCGALFFGEGSILKGSFAPTFSELVLVLEFFLSVVPKSNEFPPKSKGSFALDSTLDVVPKGFSRFAGAPATEEFSPNPKKESFALLEQFSSIDIVGV